MQASPLQSHSKSQIQGLVGRSPLTMALGTGVLLVLQQICSTTANTGVPPQARAVPRHSIPQAGRFLLGIRTQLLGVAPGHLKDREKWRFYTGGGGAI